MLSGDYGTYYSGFIQKDFSGESFNSSISFLFENYHKMDRLKIRVSDLS